jgi:hypothetical protein
MTRSGILCEHTTNTSSNLMASQSAQGRGRAYHVAIHFDGYMS